MTITYRVEFDDKGHAHVESLCYALDMDPLQEGVYESIEALPQWVQDRLHVLSTFSSKPPTIDVAGLGRRIEERIFWVHK
jgi:hypothetical protein